MYIEYIIRLQQICWFIIVHIFCLGYVIAMNQPAVYLNVTGGFYGFVAVPHMSNEKYLGCLGFLVGLYCPL